MVVWVHCFIIVICNSGIGQLCKGLRVWGIMWQVDPRLPEEAQQRVKKRLADLFESREVDGKRSSVVLAKAYHDITRKQILNM